MGQRESEQAERARLYSHMSPMSRQQHDDLMEHMDAMARASNCKPMEWIRAVEPIAAHRR